MAHVGSLAVGLALVLGLAGCGKAGDLIATEPTRGPTSKPTQTAKGPDVVPAPEVGACRNLTLDDIAPATNDDPEVPCKQPHTAVTYRVDEWPDRLTKTADGVGDPRLRDYVLTACDRAWRRTVGGDLEARVTSVASWAWYAPTAQQYADGAHWFRCDLIAGDDTGRLEVLPGNVDGLLEGSYDDRYRSCWTKVFSDKPNVDEGTVTSCARKHQQRAVGTVTLGREGEKYPGQQAVFDESNDRCADVVAEWRGARQPGDFGLQWPRRDRWKDGERYATCWAVTRR